MSLTIKGTAAALLVAASVGISACGAPSTPTSPQEKPPSGERALNATSDDATPDKKDGGWEECLKKLNLTAEQKAKLQVLKDEAKPPFTKDELKTMADQFKAAMLADKVDKDALKAWLAPIVAKIDAGRTTRLDTLEKVRNLLTPEQRQAAATAILDRLAKRKDWKDKMGRLGRMGKKDHMMTPEQKAAFAWMRHGSMAAVASYMLSGDKATLAANMTSDKSVADRVTAMADALAGLSLDQRKALVKKMEEHGKKMAKKSVQMADEDDQDNGQDADNS